MFERLVRVARVFDEDGRHIEADVLTLAMVRLAQILDSGSRARERETEIERQMGNLADSEVIGTPETEEMPHEEPKYHKKGKGYKQEARPGLEEILDPAEYRYKTKVPINGKLTELDKTITRPIINLMDEDKRQKYYDYYSAMAKNGDPNAERALEIMHMMEDAMDDPRTNPSFTPYGDYGVWAPAYGDTMFESKKGGKYNLAPFFLTQEMAEQNSGDMLKFLQDIMSGKRQRARADTEYFSGNRKKQKMPFDEKNTKPNVWNDVVLDRILEKALAPELSVLSNLRAEKAIEEGRDPNTRKPKPDEYRGWDRSWLARMDPKSKMFMKKQVYEILDAKIHEFMDSYGMSLPEATHYAITSLIGEGKGGIGGIRSYRLEDTGSAKIHPLGGKPGKKKENRYLTLPQMERGIQQKIAPEWQDLGGDYSDVKPDVVRRSPLVLDEESDY